MRFKLAALKALAKCHGGRATLDEVKRQAETIIASEDQTEQLKRVSAFGDIDLFQSGLVISDESELQITDAGRSLLNALETGSEPCLRFSSSPMSKSLKLIDDLIGAEDRPTLQDTDYADLKYDETIAADRPNASPSNAPAFLVRSFGSAVQRSSRTHSRRLKIFAPLADRIQRVLTPWRGHLEQQ